MKPSAETTSRNRRSNWDAVSQSAPRGKEHPTPSSNSGTQFPDGGHLGKRIPLWSLIPGRSFPKRTQRESASRFEAQKWDALSARNLNGKARPTLRPDSGTQFPKQTQRESVSHSGVEFRDAVSEASPKGNCVPFRVPIPGRGFRFKQKAPARDGVGAKGAAYAVDGERGRPVSNAARALPYPRLRTRLYGVSTIGRSGRSLPSNAR